MSIHAITWLYSLVAYFISSLLNCKYLAIAKFEAAVIPGLVTENKNWAMLPLVNSNYYGNGGNHDLIFSQPEWNVLQE